MIKREPESGFPEYISEKSAPFCPLTKTQKPWLRAFTEHAHCYFRLPERWRGHSEKKVVYGIIAFSSLKETYARQGKCS